jgi:hypothetical protein
MATVVTVAGQAYSIPAEGDSGYATDLTNFFIQLATSTKILQSTSTVFPIVQDLSFGTSFGLKLQYLKSQAANPSATGQVRLGNAESVSWRNAANSADLALSVNSTDALQFNGSSVLMPGLGSIVNSDISASAVIDYSKLSVPAGAIAYLKLSLTDSVVNSDVSASAAIDYSKINVPALAIAYSKITLSNSVVNTDIAASAAIVYSKLSLAGSIVNADVSTSAAIAYSKLALTGAVLNADISASAAIARSKLAALTASRAMVTDGTGIESASAVTATELSYVSGVTSAIQTQLAGKTANSIYSAKGSILAATAAATPADLPTGTFGQVLTSDASQTAGLKWSSPATGSFNFIANPNAEGGTTSWATYADTPGAVPVSGSGGSPTVTWTQNTSTPLDGTASFLYTKPASNVQGNGVATAAFAVPEVYRGTVLQGQLAYKVTSGTYADGDLQLFFYDITNSVLVYMTEGQSILNAVGAAQQLFRFQMPYNCLSGRFIIHQASTSSSALTLLIDDVQIGPQLVSRGVAVTDWVAFTPSITNGGTTGSNQAWYRRVGDTAELQYYTVFTGTGSSGNMQWSFPTGLVLDTTKTTGGNGRTVAGAGTWNSSASSTNIMANPQPASTTTVSLLQSGINGILQGSSAVSGDVIAFHLVIPVLGWSSNVAVSSDIGSRPIVFSASAQLPTASLTNGSFVTMTFPTATVDTVGGYSGGIYTIKETGWYDLDFDTFITGSFGTYGGAFAGFKINGSGQSYYRYNELSGTVVVLSVGSHPTGLLLTAGTTIQPVVETLGWSSVSVGADTNMHFFGVKKSSSSSQTIAASDPVTAQYFDTSAPSLNNGPNTLLYGTKGFDSHGAYNTSTGIYTFPAPGKYLLSATYVVTGLATTAQFIILTANINSGSLIYTLGQTPGDGATTTFSVNGSTIINAKAGDTLQLQLATSTAGNQTGANGAGKNYFSLARISN